MARLFRSSSMGGSVDSLIRPIKLVRKPLVLQDKKQTSTTAANSLKEKVALPQFVKQETRKKSIFTLGSPPRNDRSEDKSRKGREDFLDACALCKKRIADDQDRYMYGYLQAFCSPKCRDDQIALDERFKPSSPVRRQTMNTLKRNLLRVKFDK